MLIPKFLRQSAVLEITGYSESTLRRREKDGLFPARKDLGGNRVGWRTDEVIEWQNKIPNKKPSNNNKFDHKRSN